MNIVTDNCANDLGSLKLTARETEILKLVAEGHTSPEIAQIVSLSHETIKWYRKRLLQKTGASNTAEMIRKASEAGLLC